MQGKSYVIRIYRRGRRGREDAPGSASLAGIIEDPETGERQSFRSAAGLWALLGGASVARRPPGRPQGKGRT